MVNISHLAAQFLTPPYNIAGHHHGLEPALAGENLLHEMERKFQSAQTWISLLHLLSVNPDLAGGQSYEHSYCYQPYTPQRSMSHACLQTSELRGGRVSLTAILRDQDPQSDQPEGSGNNEDDQTQSPTSLFLWPLSDCSI